MSGRTPTLPLAKSVRDEEAFLESAVARLARLDW